MEYSKKKADKSTQQAITMILAIAALFLGMPVVQDQPAAGLIIFSLPAIHYLYTRLVGAKEMAKNAK